MTRDGDVVARRQVGQQVELLEHERHAALAQAGAAGLGHGRQVLTGHAHLSRAGWCQAADDVKKRGLPRARGSHDGHELARLHGEIHSPQRRHFHLPHPVGLAQVAGFDNRTAIHRTAPRWCRAGRR